MNTMTNSTEQIKVDNENWWICICGNEPHTDGFYTCDANGYIMSPAEDGGWDQKHYICMGCNRIIDADTAFVTAKANKLAQRHNELYDWDRY